MIFLGYNRENCIRQTMGSALISKSINVGAALVDGVLREPHYLDFCWNAIYFYCRKKRKMSLAQIREEAQ